MIEKMTERLGASRVIITFITRKCIEKVGWGVGGMDEVIITTILYKDFSDDSKLDSCVTDLTLEIRHIINN